MNNQNYNYKYQCIFFNIVITIEQVRQKQNSLPWLSEIW